LYPVLFHLGNFTVTGYAAMVDFGLVAGAIVVGGVRLLDRIGVDDPVGAVPVHGLHGIWGTVAVGLFATPKLVETVGIAGMGPGLLYGGGLGQLGTQVLGVACGGLFSLVVMGGVFLAIKRTVGLRVSREEELRGLDIGEHGIESYAGFQIFVTE